MDSDGNPNRQATKAADSTADSVCLIPFVTCLIHKKQEVSPMFNLHTRRKDSGTPACTLQRDAYNRCIRDPAAKPVKDVLDQTVTMLCGLDERPSLRTAHRFGTNKVTHQKKQSLAQRVAGAFINLFTAILFFLALVSAVTDMLFPALSLFGSTPEDFDCLTVAIILTMVFISGVLRFVQESRSGNAAAKLLSMITTTCTVDRKGHPMQEIGLDEVVVGDIVHLSAGDMIPADLRIIEAKDLFISQSGLTGESEPVEKRTRLAARTPTAPSPNIPTSLLWAATSFRAAHCGVVLGRR